ncbi:forespore capture DNA-binding protein RefZ [Anaerobacillus sp. MEB173]|uniref:forespore capture DNA-binding protein RefZ n=1 Tax=Anaerobacillus sp. MEB173 TaxID=3383345 RepID=UPI003F92905E
MEKVAKTKQKVVDAAVALFNVQGYNGTSIREIAKRADVNPALVSYYFGGKKGLLETLMTTFLEGYVTAIEEAVENISKKSAKTCLVEMINNILVFQQKHHHLARFVHRETTLDTTLVRELMSTYMMKEKHYYRLVIEHGIKQMEFSRLPIDFFIMQLRGMLIMPYLHPQYIREVYHLIPHERYFLERYMTHITKWVEDYICLNKGDEIRPNSHRLIIKQ